MWLEQRIVGTPMAGSDIEGLGSVLSGGTDFARAVLTKVMGECLGAENPRDRPAEFMVERPVFVPPTDGSVFTKNIGVQMRLMGVSRTRKSKQFHDALKTLEELAARTIAENLKAGRAQLFVVIMLDGDVETWPGSGKYSNMLESAAVWIETSSHQA